MSVAILTITHGNVGHELLTTAKSMLGNQLPLECKSLSVSESCNPDDLVTKAIETCKKINQGNGVLVLTDIFGSTPSNICNKLKQSTNIDVHVIAGLSLPMLTRVMNYPDLSLDELVQKALSGAHDGIIDCQANE